MCLKCSWDRSLYYTTSLRLFQTCSHPISSSRWKNQIMEPLIIGKTIKWTILTKYFWFRTGSIRMILLKSMTAGMNALWNLQSRSWSLRLKWTRKIKRLIIWSSLLTWALSTIKSRTKVLVFQNLIAMLISWGDKWAKDVIS